MRRRSRPGGDLVKKRRHKAVTLKRRNARKVRGRGTPAPDQDTEIARVIRERDRALEQLSQAVAQQTATSDVLRVISSSPGELDPVFQAMLANATRICEAKFGVLFRSEGDALRAVAVHGAPLPYVEERRRNPVIRPNPKTTLGRAVATKQTVQHADVLEVPDYFNARSGYTTTQLTKLAGARTVLAVPMIKKNELIGAIVIYRQEVRPFTNKQIALLETFAAQAVIAIENARLLNELRQRTDDLTESLEQQTATSEVLRVISSSPGELEPVFQAMLENAVRICEAKFGALYRIDGEKFHFAAEVGTPLEFVEHQRRRGPFQPSPGSQLERVLRTRQVSHTDDATVEFASRPAATLAGARSTVAVPMLKDDVLIGAIFIYRTEVRPFTEKQIELVKNFAAQAVIAIENTRLFNELRQSLEQQTATSEVLRVISSSPGELKPVFQAMLENATRICEAKSGFLFLAENDDFRIVASLHQRADIEEQMKHRAFKFGPSTPNGRARLTRQIVHVPNLAEDRAYLEREPLAVWAVEQANVRTVLVVPMLKEEKFIGVFGIERDEVKPFTDKQIELVKNFAAQAVIAIENTRLLNELRQRTADLSESLEQQTATSEVLKVISSSPGDLQPVFQAMLENATRICDAVFGNIYRREGDGLHLVASHNTPAAFVEHRQGSPYRPSSTTPMGRAIASKTAVHVLDAAVEPAYIEERDPGMVEGVELGNVRTFIAVPLLKETELIGVLTVFRQEVRAFTDKQIQLLQNFAAQAVIAIENTRLLNELRQRTDDLTESLEQQTATSEVLKVISSSPGDLQSVFSALLENAVRICGAKFGALPLWEGDSFRIGALHNPPPAFAAAVQRGPLRPGPNVPVGRMASTKQVVHVADITQDPGYIERDPLVVAGVEKGGYRTILAVPMLKEDEVIGGIVIFRREVRPFTDKQVKLVQNFAAQAVIAIENTRLLNELRESLQQQTATSEVLKVISSSPGELEPVFKAMLENATRICEAKFGTLFLRDGDVFRFAAEVGTPPALAEHNRQLKALVPTPGSTLDQVMRTKQVSHTADAAAAAVPGYSARLGGARSTVFVPMLKDDQLVGVIIIYRQEVRPFTDKQVALVENFAAQAVIAIENTRLLNELRESLQQQTATADILRIISASPGDLEPVFVTILDKALHLCEAAFGFVTTYDGVRIERVAQRGVPEALAAYFEAGMDQARPGDAHWRLVEGEDLIHNLDQMDEDAYRLGNPLRRAVVDLGGARTALVVALRKDKVLLGALTVYRKEVRRSQTSKSR